MILLLRHVFLFSKASDSDYQSISILNLMIKNNIAIWNIHYDFFFITSHCTSLWEFTSQKKHVCTTLTHYFMGHSTFSLILAFTCLTFTQSLPLFVVDAMLELLVMVCWCCYIIDTGITIGDMMQGTQIINQGMFCQGIGGLPVAGAHLTCLCDGRQEFYMQGFNFFIIGKTHSLFVLYQFVIIINNG